MPEKLILEGNLYTGEILAEIHYGPRLPMDWGKYECEFRFYHYFGTGVVKDLHSGSRYNFALMGGGLGERFGQQCTITKKSRFPHSFFGENTATSQPVTSSEPRTLEETIFCLKSPQEGYKIVPVPDAISEFIDFTLAQIVDEVAASKEAIPIIYRPTKMNQYELISRGYCRLEAISGERQAA